MNGHWAAWGLSVIPSCRYPQVETLRSYPNDLADRPLVQRRSRSSFLEAARAAHHGPIAVPGSDGAVAAMSEHLAGSRLELRLGVSAPWLARRRAGWRPSRPSGFGVTCLSDLSCQLAFDLGLLMEGGGGLSWLLGFELDGYPPFFTMSWLVEGLCSAMSVTPNWV